MITVSLTGSGGARIVGENYTLTCNVTGGVITESTYRWFRNGLLLDETSNSTLSFLPLLESESGVYTCEGTRSSIIRTSANYTLAVSGEFQMHIRDYIIEQARSSMSGIRMTLKKFPGRYY